MDEFFWVIMLVLYLIFQVLGGRRKKQKKRARQRQAAQTRDRATQTSSPARTEPGTRTPARSPELDEALLEIRRALGFPVESRTPEPAGAEAPTSREEASPAAEPVSEDHGFDFRPAGEFEGAPPPLRRQTIPPRPKPVSRPILKPSRFPEMGRLSVTSPRSTMTEGLRVSRDVGEQTVTPPAEVVDVYSSRPTQAKGVSADLVRRHLKSSQSLREAFVLKEIFDAPRSKRPLR